MKTEPWEQHVDFPYEVLDGDIADFRVSAPQVYRACAQRLLPILFGVLDSMPDCPQKWAWMFAVSHPACQGRSMADVAAQIGVSRAFLSSLARENIEAHQLPPSSYMRTEENARLARKIRLAVIEKNKAKQHK